MQNQIETKTRKTPGKWTRRFAAATIAVAAVGGIGVATAAPASALSFGQDRTGLYMDWNITDQTVLLAGTGAGLVAAACAISGGGACAAAGVAAATIGAAGPGAPCPRPGYVWRSYYTADGNVYAAKCLKG